MEFIDDAVSSVILDFGVDTIVFRLKIDHSIPN